MRPLLQRGGALILAALMLILAACSAGEDQTGAPVYTLYFQEADFRASAGGDALRPETAEVPKGELSQAEALMNALLQGPTDEGLKSPIPAGTQLLSLKVERGRAVVDLSAAYGSLSGVALTMADYAITLTLTQLPEITSVRITVRGQDLAYRDKQVFSARDVLLTPKGDMVGTVAVRLFFPDEGGHLQWEERTLELYEGDTQVGAVAKALESGPESKQITTALSEGLRVRSCWLEEEVCCVNLSSAQLESLPEGGTLSAALKALRLSLLSLESVKEVRFLVDGEFADRYGAVAFPS